MAPHLMLLIVCPLVFLAGFIDSIAGGGGLISIPAYLLAGLPTHLAMGSNKLSAGAGTAFATWRFQKHGKIHLQGALISAAFALGGAAIGARINLLIDADRLQKILLFLLPLVAIITLLGGRKKERASRLAGWPLLLVCALAGLLIGLYDGLAGPGTGSFLIIIYSSLAGYDYVTASGNAKVVNLAANLASLTVFLYSGKVLFWLALPAAACSIAGSFLGSQLALKRGRGLIRGILFLVMLAIIGKLAADIYLN